MKVKVTDEEALAVAEILMDKILRTIDDFIRDHTKELAGIDDISCALMSICQATFTLLQAYDKKGKHQDLLTKKLGQMAEIIFTTHRIVKGELPCKESSHHH